MDSRQVIRMLLLALCVVGISAGSRADSAKDRAWGSISLQAADFTLDRWQIRPEIGNTSETALAAAVDPRGNAALRVDYVFACTDPSSSQNVDNKGRDTCFVATEAKWDTRPYTWLSFYLRGDGSQHNMAIDFVDSSNRVARYGRFCFADKNWRKYECTLSAPCEKSPGFDASQIREIRLYLDEAGEDRYLKNHGTIIVSGIRLSSDDKRRDLADCVRTMKNYCKQKGMSEFNAEVSLLEAALESGNKPCDDLESGARTLKNKILIKMEALKCNRPAESVDYALGVESPMVKVGRDPYLFNGGMDSTLNLSAAGNEYENGQIVIIPLRGNMRGIRVSCAGDLTHTKNGHMISAANVDIRLVEYVETKPTIFTFYDYIGWTPDPLMKNAQFDVKAGEVQPVWVTVYVPAGTPEGRYTGELLVSHGNTPVKKVRLDLHVYGFNLPKEHHLSRQHIYWLPAVANWYGYRDGADSCGYNADGYGIPPDVIKRHLDFLLKYRIDIMNIGWTFDANTGEACWPVKRTESGYDYSLLDDLVKFCFDRGMIEFSMGDFGRSKLLTSGHKRQCYLARCISLSGTKIWR